MNINKIIVIVLFTFSTLLILAGHFLNLSFEPPRKDGLHYIAYAYNTLKYQVFDNNRSERPKPDNRREPGYPFVLMVGMFLHPGIDIDKQDANCLVYGRNGCLEKISYLKICNIVLLIGCAVLASYIVYIFTKSHITSLITLILVLSSNSLITIANRFLSEIFTAFLILIVSISFYHLVNKKFSYWNIFFTGISMGLLTLTKAIFYYSIVIFSFLIIYWLVKDRGIKPVKIFVKCGIFIAGFYLIVAPWIVRNYFYLDTLSIAGRSGLVLNQRANMNDLIFEDYFGSVLYFVNKSYYLKRQRQKGSDLDLYNKLNNDKAKQDAYLYSKRVKRDLSLKRPERDRYMFNNAKERILSNFVRHSLATFPLIFRGIIKERGYGFLRYNNNSITLGNKYFSFEISRIYLDIGPILSIFYVFVFFIVFFYSFIHHNWRLFWFLLPSVYMFFMYALLTHFESRYLVPLIPVYIICCSVFIWKMLNILLEKLKNYMNLVDSYQIKY